MARKNEVDLVIKAENQFSKTLKSAVDAFNEFQTILKGTTGARSMSARR